MSGGMMDVCIIGGGIIGGSITYNLIELGFKGKIEVYEKLDALAQGSTSLCAGGARNLWSTKINMELTSYSLKKFANFKEEMGMGIGYEKIGYLFCLYEDSYSRIKDFLPEWQKRGVKAELISDKEIEKKVPGIKINIDRELKELTGMERIAGGLFGPDCCSLNATSCAQGYFEKAKGMGNVKINLNKEVERIVIENERVIGIEFKSGERVNTEICILCAGAWAGEILKKSGLELPAEPVKRMLFTTNLPPIKGWDKIPMTIIDRGIYFRRETGNLLIGRAREDQAPGFDTKPEPEYYRDEMNLYMQERIPGTQYCRIISGWGGLYTITPDDNAIVGKYPGVTGLYLATGFSGHGVMESPAIGRCMAELLLRGRYETIDLSSLSIERFKRGELIKETIVI
jgi:glycine/D-amino acid oxidase-like deaminating enzyme